VLGNVAPRIGGEGGGGTNKLGRASGRQEPNQKSGELPLTYFACLYVPQVAEETAQFVLNTAALFTVILPFVPSSLVSCSNDLDFYSVGGWFDVAYLDWYFRSFPRLYHVRIIPNPFPVVAHHVGVV